MHSAPFYFVFSPISYDPRAIRKTFLFYRRFLTRCTIVQLSLVSRRFPHKISMPRAEQYILV